MNRKPAITIDPDGPEGNIYFILGKAVKAVITAGGWSAVSKTRAAVLQERVLSDTHSYEEAVSAIEEYVDIKWKGGKPMM